MFKSILSIIVITLLFLVVSEQNNTDVLNYEDIPQILQEYKPQSHGIRPPSGRKAIDNIVINVDHKGASVQITPAQYCDACHATIDTGIVLLRRFEQNEKRQKHPIASHIDDDRLKGQISRTTKGKSSGIDWPTDSMVADICSHALARYKPYLMIGCTKLLTEHSRTAFNPWTTNIDPARLSDNNFLIEHKYQFCTNIANACEVDRGMNDFYLPTVDNIKRTKDTCENCIVLANDMRTVLDRLITTINYKPSDYGKEKGITNVLSEEALSAFTSSYCSSLSMRHFKPMYMEEVCEDMVLDEDNRETLHKLINNGTLLYHHFIDPQRWEKTLCVNKFDYCESQEDYDKIYEKWDAAAEADFNVLHAEFSLKKEQKPYVAEADRLREYFYYGDLDQVEAEVSVDLAVDEGSSAVMSKAMGMGSDGRPIKSKPMDKDGMFKNNRDDPMLERELGIRKQLADEEVMNNRMTCSESGEDACTGKVAVKPSSKRSSKFKKRAVKDKTKVITSGEDGGDALFNTTNTNTNTTESVNDVSVEDEEKTDTNTNTNTNTDTDSKIRTANVLSPLVEAHLKRKLDAIESRMKEAYTVVEKIEALEKAKKIQKKHKGKRRVSTLPNSLFVSKMTAQQLDIDVKASMDKMYGDIATEVYKDTLNKLNVEGEKLKKLKATDEYDDDQHQHQHQHHHHDGECNHDHDHDDHDHDVEQVINVVEPPIANDVSDDDFFRDEL